MSTNSRSLPVALILLFAGAYASATPTVSVDTSLTSVVERAMADPAKADIGELWRQFRAERDFDAVMDAFDVTDLIENSGPLAESCREHRTSLLEALRVVPVSIRLQKLALDCAQATDEASEAQRRELMLTALVEHAVRDGRGQIDRNPISVVVAADAYALVSLLGREVLDDEYYFDDVAAYRYLPLIITTYSEDDRIETDLSFDYLDTWMALLRSNPEAKYPSFRRELAAEVVKNLAESGEPGAQIGMIRVKLATDPEIKEISAMRQDLIAMIKGGNERARITLAEVCLKARNSSCMDEAIDLLVPMVEQHRSAALILMAAAYAHGIGVERDAEAVKLLTDKAIERSGKRHALGRFAISVFAAGIEEVASSATTVEEVGMKAMGNIGPASEAALQSAADAGDPWSQLMIGGMKMSRGDASGKAFVEQAAEAGQAEAMFSMASMARMLGNEKHAIQWFERAAAQDQADSQFEIAKLLMSKADASADDQRRAMDLLQRAAHGNSGDAAIMLAERAIASADGNEAINWLSGCRVFSAFQCLFRMAEILQHGAPGLDADAEAALKLYDALTLDGHPSSALIAARLRLQSSDSDVVRAGMAAIRDLAESGSSDAQFAISMYMFDIDPATAIQWLTKCSDARSVNCRGRLGMAYAQGIGVAVDTSKARTLLNFAAVRDDTFAQNELAWMLCTHADESVRDPKLGASWADKVVQKDRDWSYLDTLAACHAADGDFDRASALQKEALALLKKEKDADKDEIADVKSRLRLFRNKKAYYETAQSP